MSWSTNMLTHAAHPHVPSLSRNPLHGRALDAHPHPLPTAAPTQVCDFGLASNTKAQAGAGTPQYMAPELFQNKPYNEKVRHYRTCAQEGRAGGTRLGELHGQRIHWHTATSLECRAKSTDPMPSAAPG